MNRKQTEGVGGSRSSGAHAADHTEIEVIEIAETSDEDAATAAQHISSEVICIDDDSDEEVPAATGHTTHVPRPTWMPAVSSVAACGGAATGGLHPTVHRRKRRKVTSNVSAAAAHDSDSADDSCAHRGTECPNDSASDGGGGANRVCPVCSRSYGTASGEARGQNARWTCTQCRRSPCALSPEHQQGSEHSLTDTMDASDDSPRVGTPTPGDAPSSTVRACAEQDPERRRDLIKSATVAIGRLSGAVTLDRIAVALRAVVAEDGVPPNAASLAAAETVVVCPDEHCVRRFASWRGLGWHLAAGCQFETETELHPASLDIDGSSARPRSATSVACGWAGCGERLGSIPELMRHVATQHLQSRDSHAAGCAWRGCTDVGPSPHELLEPRSFFISHVAVHAFLEHVV
jgi:hypothetical protein